MASDWNFANVWETVARTLPERVAQVHGEQRLSWDTFDARADGIASLLIDEGCSRQDKVALYLHNRPEYLQAAFGCMKAGLVPVNTNYRYRRDELHYLWDNADAAAVVFQGMFVDRVDEIRQRCTKVRLWIHVQDGTATCPSWAVDYEDAVRRAQRRGVQAPWGRSGDDLILIYTGGTTGRPRGVMWRQHDLYLASNTTGDPEDADLDHIRSRIAASAVTGTLPIGLPAAPLMHGTAYVFASTILNRGGCVVTMPGERFDVDELLTAIERETVTDLCIVGDAFCRPMVDVLDDHSGRWDIGSLRVVSSSGMMWSEASKRRLLEHAPRALLIDFLNSSEASGMGRAISSSKVRPSSARFRLGENAVVLDESERPVVPGSGVVGRIAVRGRVPIGYYGDPEKTAATFPVIDGVRHAIPGDFATVEADGTIRLLGRGSVSINTGGEKVFPEEVEECIKLLAYVRDVAVVGVPDKRFGERVVAVVELVPDTPLDPAVLREHVKLRLASYKVPRNVVVIDSIRRGPNGKADYPWLRQRALEALAQTDTSAMSDKQERS